MIPMLLINHPGHIRPLSTGVYGQPRISTGKVTEQLGELGILASDPDNSAPTEREKANAGSEPNVKGLYNVM